MPISPSPLRYPGGKTVLYDFLGALLEENNLQDCLYVEPYAGGAGAAIKLLYSEYASKILINDIDRHIYEFWNAVVNNSHALIQMIDETEVTVEEWETQKNVYKNIDNHSDLEIGFSTLFLNRCNRSGILTAGIIGGKEQKGKWKIDARFKKKKLIKKIEMISLYKKRIILENKDAVSLIAGNSWPEHAFVYLDPPYYNKGKELYYNHYTHADHERLSNLMKIYSKHKWLLSYDNSDEIMDMYNDFRLIRFSINYSSNRHKKGNEIMILDPNTNISNECISLLNSVEFVN